MAIGHEHIKIPSPPFHFLLLFSRWSNVKKLQSFDVVILCSFFLLLLWGGRRGVYNVQVPSAFHYANELCVNCVRVFILSFVFCFVFSLKRNRDAAECGLDSAAVGTRSMRIELFDGRPAQEHGRSVGRHRTLS